MIKQPFLLYRISFLTLNQFSRRVCVAIEWIEPIVVTIIVCDFFFLLFLSSYFHLSCSGITIIMNGWSVGRISHEKNMNKNNLEIPTSIKKMVGWKPDWTIRSNEIQAKPHQKNNDSFCRMIWNRSAYKDVKNEMKRWHAAINCDVFRLRNRSRQMKISKSMCWQNEPKTGDKKKVTTTCKCRLRIASVSLRHCVISIKVA